MKICKTVCYSVALVSCMMALSGCGKMIRQEAEHKTPYYSIAIDGTKLYLGEENKDVIKLLEIGSNYVYDSVTVDYRSQENAFDELDYYTAATRYEYVEYEYIEYFTETEVYYEQVQELVDSNLISMQFYELNGTPRALLNYEYVSRVTHSTDEYLEDVGIKADTDYKRTMTIFFVIEDDEWKIESYDVTVREEV